MPRDGRVLLQSGSTGPRHAGFVFQLPDLEVNTCCCLPSLTTSSPPSSVHVQERNLGGFEALLVPSRDEKDDK
jgi:hypothetical protein